jgi:hypothetical protein
MAFGNSQLWIALITFLYLDFLDATGTMWVGVALRVGVGWGRSLQSVCGLDCLCQG